MNFYRTVPLAMRSLSRNPLRSFFMMLGVTIGIASLTALASVGEATKQETMRGFKRMMGTFDTVIIQPGAARTRGMPTLASVEPVLKFDDAEAVRTEISGVRAVAPMQFALDLDVKYREKTTSPSVIGVSANWTEIRGEEVAIGNGISEDDVRSLARVAVIGQDVRQALFPDEDPVGKTLRIADVPFQVAGVLARHGVGPGGGSMDNMLIIPVTTASKRLFNRDYLTAVVAQLKDAEQSDKVIAEVTALLRERHGIVPPRENDFMVTSPRATMAQVTKMGSTLSKVLTGVAVIATLIGGTVIMSLMLIAVSERRREIGIRRAVGATRRDIMLQFLVEAAVIAAVGGIAGVLIGAAGTTVATLLKHLPVAFLWSAIGGSVLLSVGIGLVFGMQPAWKASNIDPIQALRS